MSQSPTSIQPEMSQLIAERKRIRQAYQQSMTEAQKLEQLTAQVNAYAIGQSPVQSLQPFSREALPPQEVQAVLPKIEQEIASVNQIEQQIQVEWKTIAEIKRKAKNLTIMLILSGIVVLIIFVLLIMRVVHG